MKCLHPQIRREFNDYLALHNIWATSYPTCQTSPNLLESSHSKTWQQDVEWTWDEPQKRALESLKDAVTRTPVLRAQNNGRSTDNVRTDCGFDRSNFRLAGHVDRSKFNRIENEINLRFLLFNYFSCYLSSRCVLWNFDMKSW